MIKTPLLPSVPKMKANVLTTSILFTLFFALLPLLAIAGPPPLDGDPGAPIDGGASLLVGAAVAYGIKKLRNSGEKTMK